jgi:translation initiation factor eIF-2B subunit delta
MSSSDPPAIVEPLKSESQVAPQAPTTGEGSAATGGKPQSPAAPVGTQKLSNAELKKQAKAEKAARRAQAVQEKQSGAATTLSAGPGQAQKTDGLRVAKGSQHKRTSSTSAGPQNLPFRGNTQKVPPANDPPKEEDKTVEFFRHLYKSRTTTVAGASKEIHPAVLALGMQMSNYTLCGSCARLVATLHAFKKVSAFCLR